MSHGTIAFFQSTSPFSFSGWELQKTNPRRTVLDYLNEFKGDGDELMHASPGSKTSGSWEYILTLAPRTEVVIPIPNVGQISSGGMHLDELTISWGNQQIKPKMTVSAHAHGVGTPHASGDCRQYAASVEIPVVIFGIPDDLGAVKLADGAVVDFRSATYKLSCSHIDEPNRTGGQLAGNNYDGVETLEVQFTGNITSDDYEIAQGWSFTDRGIEPSNVGATVSSISLVHHVAHVVPVANATAAVNPAAAPDGQIV